MHVLAPLPSPENEPGSASWTMSDHWQEPSHPSRALSQGQWMPSNLGLPGGLGGGARDSAVAKAPAVQTPALGPPSAPTLRFLLSPRPPPGQPSSSRGPCRLLRVTGQREGPVPRPGCPGAWPARSLRLPEQAHLHASSVAFSTGRLSKCRCALGRARPSSWPAVVTLRAAGGTRGGDSLSESCRPWGPEQPPFPPGCGAASSQAA